MSSSPLSSRKWWINRQTAYWTAGEYSLLFTKSIQLILKKVAYRVEFKSQVVEEVQKAVTVIIDGIFIYLYICFLDLWGNARDISWESTLLALSGKMLVVFKHSTYRIFLYIGKKSILKHKNELCYWITKLQESKLSPFSPFSLVSNVLFH